MDAEKSEKLRKSLFTLTQQMRNADRVAQYLYSNKQLSMNQRDEIRNECNTGHKNKLLLGNILHRDTVAYDMLYEVLYQTNQQPLCQMLWVPSLGPYPQIQTAAPVEPVSQLNAELQSFGYPRGFLYRHGEDPTPTGDVIDDCVT